MPRKPIPPDERCPTCKGTGRRPPMGRPPKVDPRQVAKLHARGLTAIQIAEKLGIHRDTVYEALKRAE